MAQAAFISAPTGRQLHARDLEQAAICRASASGYVPGTAHYRDRVAKARAYVGLARESRLAGEA